VDKTIIIVFNLIAKSSKIKLVSGNIEISLQIKSENSEWKVF